MTLQKVTEIEEPSWLLENMTADQMPSYLLTQVAMYAHAYAKMKMFSYDQNVALGADRECDEALEEVRIVLAAIARRAGLNEAVI